MEWRPVERRQIEQTQAGIWTPVTRMGWECNTPTCRNMRWQERRPEDQCELCCPAR